MISQQCFSLRRVFLFIKSDMILQCSIITTTLLTTLAVLLLFNFISPNNILDVDSNPSFFIFLLFGGGIWLSSLAFRNFHESPQSNFFIMLPCSNLEKFIARWIETSIGYAIVLLVFYSIFYWVIGLVTVVIVGSKHFITLPFLANTWHLILHYMILQSIFFLGSITFKRYSFIKTILTLVCIGIFLLIISAIFTKTLLELHPVYFFNALINNDYTHSIIFSIFNFILAPICLLVTYFRLCELEV